MNRDRYMELRPKLRAFANVTLFTWSGSVAAKTGLEPVLFGVE